MIIYSDKDIFDDEIGHLVWHLELLDKELTKVTNLVSRSSDPESEGLCERGEYIIGAGLAAIQRYATSTYIQTGMNKEDVLNLPPCTKKNIPLMKIISAGANLWKHQEEWPWGKELKSPARNTVTTTEELTPWSDYTLSNLLAEILGDKEFNLSNLLPHIEEWCENLVSILKSQDEINSSSIPQTACPSPVEGV